MSEMIVVYVNEWNPRDDSEKTTFLAIVNIPKGISEVELDKLVEDRWRVHRESMTNVLRWIYLPVMTVDSECKIVEANDE